MNLMIINELEWHQKENSVITLVEEVENMTNQFSEAKNRHQLKSNAHVKRLEDNSATRYKINLQITQK
jgi:hypothetical protein